MMKDRKKKKKKKKVSIWVRTRDPGHCSPKLTAGAIQYSVICTAVCKNQTKHTTIR